MTCFIFESVREDKCSLFTWERMFCMYVLLVLRRWYAGSDDEAVDDESLPGSVVKLARTGMVGE